MRRVAGVAAPGVRRPFAAARRLVAFVAFAFGAALVTGCDVDQQAVLRGDGCLRVALTYAGDEDGALILRTTSPTGDSSSLDAQGRSAISLSRAAGDGFNVCGPFEEGTWEVTAWLDVAGDESDVCPGPELATLLTDCVPDDEDPQGTATAPVELGLVTVAVELIDP